MKKYSIIPVLFSVAMVSLLIGCGEDVEPMSGVNPTMTVSPGDETKEVSVGTVVPFVVELSGERATFSSLSVTQSFDGQIIEYILVNNKTGESLGTPYSAEFNFVPTSEMQGKNVTLLFKYENKATTNSGATVINSGTKTIQITVI